MALRLSSASEPMHANAEKFFGSSRCGGVPEKLLCICDD
jgi:hypothetical protein